MVKASNTFLHFFRQSRNDLRSPRSKSAPPVGQKAQEVEPSPLYKSSCYVAAAVEDARSVKSSSGESDRPTSTTYTHWEAWMDQEDILTVMIRNLPCSCKREHVQEAIQKLGFQDRHDFLYIPTRNGSTRGYAFIGFPHASVTREFVRKMTGYKFSGKASPKFTTVVPASIQGAKDNLSHFKSTRVMTHKNARPLFNKQ